MRPIFYRCNLEYETQDNDAYIRTVQYYTKKETPKGYRLDVGPFRKKRVPKRDNFNKQFARDTKEKAIAHLKRRLKKRIKRYKIFTRQCNLGIDLINNGKF